MDGLVGTMLATGGVACLLLAVGCVVVGLQAAWSWAVKLGSGRRIPLRGKEAGVIYRRKRADWRRRDGQR